jgi:phosphoribosyl 1,2-cyclic phosphate phosphodiesterase
MDTFAYITDAKTISDLEVEKLQDLDVLVINALRIEPHVSHFNLEEALAFIKLVNPKRAFLTHLSHHLGFHEAVQKNLPPNVYLAYDQLQISI